ncbi:OmpW family protein [Microvirga sp. W0021]|uniref:OmpW family protein n=1 Tax=Hohaiivirga grylli TaxID=3133970 RepID=A0ABV0BHX6_9HYPH
MKRLLLTTLLASTVLVPAISANAADLPRRERVEAPIELWNPWMIRVRALGVMPQKSDKSRVKLDGVGEPGSNISTTYTVVPELDISYFFTKNIAVELILGTTPHSVKGAGSLAGVGRIGRTWLLPPTLTLQYHFNLTDNIKPYVGAGVNYTIFYNNKSRGDFTGFKVNNAFGVALQAGVDFMIDKHWGLNVDVKKLWLRPTAKAWLGDTFVKTKAKLDPWLIGVGVTYKF